MPKCSVCRTELEEGQKFCFECGAPVPQTKKCIKCGAEIALKMKFCPECGANQNGEANAVTAGFSMGDKNVIAGDVIGHKEETHIAGNATFIKNEDQTKQVKKCHVCGSLVQIVEGFDCPECSQFTCQNCYDEKDGCCTECAEKHGEQKTNRYKEALKMVLADGRIEFSERKELISLQQELGISAEKAKQLEEEVKKAALGVGSEITTFEKVSLDKATNLFYKEGNVKEALNLLEPVYKAHKNDEKVLDAYLPVLAEAAPLEALDVINGLQIDILTAFVVSIGIYIKQKNLVEAEKRLNQALRIWHESSLLKCYNVLFNYAMYKQFNDFSFMEKACNLAEQLGEAHDELELSYQVKVQAILQAEVGETVDEFDKDFCEQNHLYWFVLINNPLLTREENSREKQRKEQEREAQIKAKEEVEKNRKKTEKEQKEKERLLNLQNEIINNPNNFEIEDLLKIENVFHNSQIQFLICRYYEKKNDFKNSFYWANQSFSQGNADGMARLASFYHNGYGCEKDLQKAYDLGKKSASMNSSWGLNFLGYCYNYGIVVKKDSNEAVRLYKLAAEQGNEFALSNLGNMYECGEYVPQNYEEAFRCYKLSAEQGNLSAQNGLGNMYFNGRGVSQNNEEAFKWYKLSAEQGNAYAQRMIGYMYQKGLGVSVDYALALDWYKLSANQGNSVAQVDIGIMYANGFGVTKDLTKTYEYYKLAAENGYSYAQFLLGSLYENGYEGTLPLPCPTEEEKKMEEQTIRNGLIEHGVYLDYEEAFKWYKLAAEQGYIPAQSTVADWYYSGKHPSVLAQDFNEAYKYWKLASDQGDIISTSNLGLLYEFGYGVPKDYNEAYRLYLIAAEQNNSWAQNKIGNFYYFGFGIEKNIHEAEKWYRRAADNGNNDAKNMLDDNEFKNALNQE